MPRFWYAIIWHADRPGWSVGSDGRDGAVFNTIGREARLSDKVTDAILESIASNKLRPGDSLPTERELGEQFGVSRTVIREAVRALSAKGMLEVKGGSGVRIVAGTEGA